jgi:hypothetical protein
MSNKESSQSLKACLHEAAGKPKFFEAAGKPQLANRDNFEQDTPETSGN